MRMAFSKIVADCRLVNEMEMVPSIMLPLMRVTIEIGLGMFSCGKKFQQRRAITHARDGAHAAVGIRVVVSKDKGWLIRLFVELFGQPVQLLISQNSLFSRIQEDEAISTGSPDCRDCRSSHEW